MSSIDFDRVLRIVGDSGRYQTLMFVVLCIPATIPVAFLVFLNVFTTATPDHWCKASPKYDIFNISEVDLKYLTVPYRIRRDGEKIFSHCSMYDDDSLEYRQLFDNVISGKDKLNINDIKIFSELISTHNVSLKNCSFGWHYDKKDYDNTLVTELDLVCDYNWFPQTTTAMFYVGCIFGNVFFGWVSDRWGRRTAILWLILLDVSISIFTSFSSNHKMYLVMRTLGGLIFPALYQIPFILGIEMMGPKHRTLAGMLICIMFALSMSLLALFAFLLPDWYKLSLATSFPFILLFSYYWIIPESPRWLLSKGRLTEAEKILETIARYNGIVIPKNILHHIQDSDSKSSPLLNDKTLVIPQSNCFVEKQAKVHEGLNSSGLEDKENCDTKITFQNNYEDNILNFHEKENFPMKTVDNISSNDADVSTVKEDNNKHTNTSNAKLEKDHTISDMNVIESELTETDNEVEEATFIDIFRYPNIRKKFLLLTFIWMANGIVYNGLSYNSTNLGVNDFLAFFIAAVIEIPANLLAWCLMSMWGRRWVLSLSFTIGGLGCVCCMFVPEEHVLITVTLAMIGKFGIAASFSVFYVFVSESFPTVVRSQAMGVASLVVSIGMLTFPYILQLTQYSRVLPMVIMGTISLLAACATVFLPETLNHPLPQTLKDGEVFGKDFKIFSMPKRYSKKCP